jgi:hypothetical protein
MMTERDGPGGAGEEERHPALRASAAGTAQPPAEFVYDNGEILLELLRGRAAEEERRRFAAGLQRLGDGRRAPVDL